MHLVFGLRTYFLLATLLTSVLGLILGLALGLSILFILSAFLSLPFFLVLTSGDCILTWISLFLSLCYPHSNTQKTISSILWLNGHLLLPLWSSISKSTISQLNDGAGSTTAILLVAPLAYARALSVDTLSLMVEHI